MKIISFWAKSHDFEIDEIQFSSNPTLLVGESGAGKTQILKALLMLRRLAVRPNRYIFVNTWNIIFIINNATYQWSGKMEMKEDATIDEKDSYLGEDYPNKYYSLKIEETLLKNGIVLFKRGIGTGKFNSMDVPQGLDDSSFIYHFRTNDLIKPIFESFVKIQHYDMTKEREKLTIIGVEKYEKYWNNQKTEQDLINSIIPIVEKLYIANGNKRWENDEKPHFDIFTKIQNNFIDIFPTVKLVFVDLKQNPFSRNITLPATLRRGNSTSPIKEFSINISIQLHNGKTISQSEISSGMLRTLFHLAEIYLSPPETVILIDEFENSLGTNCMDVLVDGILHENKNVQYIITSHHPYIINNVPYQHWKVVSRDENGVVKTQNGVDAFGIGKSKQSAYSQLMKFQNHED